MASALSASCFRATRNLWYTCAVRQCALARTSATRLRMATISAHSPSVNPRSFTSSGPASAAVERLGGSPSGRVAATAALTASSCVVVSSTSSSPAAAAAAVDGAAAISATSGTCSWRGPRVRPRRQARGLAGEAKGAFNHERRRQRASLLRQSLAARRKGPSAPRRSSQQPKSLPPGSLPPAPRPALPRLSGSGAPPPGRRHSLLGRNAGGGSSLSQARGPACGA